MFFCFFQHKNHSHEKGPEEDLAVAYQEFIPIIIEAIKEQQKLIEEQEVRIKQLEEERGEIAQLKEMIKASQEMVVYII